MKLKFYYLFIISLNPRSDYSFRKKCTSIQLKKNWKSTKVAQKLCSSKIHSSRSLSLPTAASPISKPRCGNKPIPEMATRIRPRWRKTNITAGGTHLFHPRLARTLLPNWWHSKRQPHRHIKNRLSSRPATVRRSRSTTEDIPKVKWFVAWRCNYCVPIWCRYHAQNTTVRPLQCLYFRQTMWMSVLPYHQWSFRITVASA